MREYGQIQSAFWQAPDIAGDDSTPALSDRAKLLACLLLTGPATNGIGCFALKNGALMDTLDWDEATTEAAFAELSRNGFAHREKGVVFIPNFLRWNRIANSNVAKARFQEWEQIPRNRFKILAAVAMLEFSEHWREEHREILEMVAQNVTEKVCQPEPNPDPTQIQPNPDPDPSIDRNRTVRAAKVKGIPDGFADFWSVYPRKEAKPKAMAAYAKTTEAERRVIATVLPQFTESWKWQNEPAYIPHPTTWLNQRRWEDDPPPKHPAVNRRSELPKPSRQAAIAETLLRDPRYAQTAERQSRMALSHGGHGTSDAHATVTALPARSRHDPGDGDGVD